MQLMQKSTTPRDICVLVGPWNPDQTKLGLGRACRFVVVKTEHPDRYAYSRCATDANSDWRIQDSAACRRHCSALLSLASLLAGVLVVAAIRVVAVRLLALC